MAGSWGVPREPDGRGITAVHALTLHQNCRWVKGGLQTTFLPAGYPNSTGNNYVNYIGWSGITNFAVTANSGACTTVQKAELNHPLSLPLAHSQHTHTHTHTHTHAPDPSRHAVLASTFLLYSVGLGAGAIATAGALNWVLKDGLGQLGTLLFGKVIAHNFDIHSKSC